jgi:hypothetical protein
LAGVNVLFPADGIPEGDEGELIQGVKSWQARQYSVKLARDTIRGQISNIRERKSAPGGVAPFGYDKQHLTADGTVLRTLRWMADGSKQEFGPDGKLIRVIARNVFVAKAKGDVVRYVPSTPDRVDVVKRIFESVRQRVRHPLYGRTAQQRRGAVDAGGEMELIQHRHAAEEPRVSRRAGLQQAHQRVAVRHGRPGQTAAQEGEAVGLEPAGRLDH